MYVGSELELFADAHRWKRYWLSQVRSALTGRVLEVGSGLGANALLLAERASSYLGVEPDATLVDEAGRRLGDTGGRISFRVGTLAHLDADERFDAIVYVDVLEHIEDDAAEVRRAVSHLASGGRLVVIAPAHRFLFSEFDRAIGHHRRYDRASLRALVPEPVRLERLRSLDSVGMLTSLANRFVLRRALPNRGQIALWDKVLVPVSRVVDPVLGHRVGRSLVGVWRLAPGEAVRSRPTRHHTR